MLKPIGKSEVVWYSPESVPEGRVGYFTAIVVDFTDNEGKRGHLALDHLIENPPKSVADNAAGWLSDPDDGEGLIEVEQTWKVHGWCYLPKMET